jgi:hypothetical protein
LTAAALAVALLAALYPELASWRDDRLKRDYSRQIIGTMREREPFAACDFDRLRALVNQHSTHQIDEEFHGYWGKPDIYARFLAAVQGRGPNPHMECSSLAGMLRSLLREMGVASRGVAIFRRTAAGMWQSHSFLEVLNQDSRTWEIQDPDYDVHWIDASIGQRVGITELIKGDLGAHVPCNHAECGWHVTSREHIAVEALRSYFVIAVVNDPDRDQRLLYANRSRFDSAAMLDDYCAYRAKACKAGVYAF